MEGGFINTVGFLGFFFPFFRSKKGRGFRPLAAHLHSNMSQIIPPPGSFRPSANDVSTKGLFTRREGYPSKRVNPSRRVKGSPGLQAKFQRYGNPTNRGQLNALGNRTRLPRVWKQVESLTRVDGLTLPGVFTREKVSPPARVTLARR